MSTPDATTSNAGKFPALNAPLFFEPYLRPMVWGSARLGELLGKSLPTDEPHGESWEISDHPLHRSMVARGPRQGESLRHLVEHHRTELLGQRGAGFETFPWLVKFLDACDWLSVQVHPDTDAVRTLWPGEGSKTEAWFVLAAEPASKIYAGLRPGIGVKELRSALADGSVADCLHQFTPRAGDCVFLPAGTVHAVGGGVLIAEVQQTSDATFRLFDWNRRDSQGHSRTLHIREALESIHWDRGPVEPVRIEDFSDPTPADRSQQLVECPYFELNFLRRDRSFELGGDGAMLVAIVLRGTGELASSDGRVPLRPGQTWLMPAEAEACAIDVDRPLSLFLAQPPHSRPA